MSYERPRPGDLVRWNDRDVRRDNCSMSSSPGEGSRMFTSPESRILFVQNVTVAVIVSVIVLPRIEQGDDDQRKLFVMTSSDGVGWVWSDELEWV